MINERTINMKHYTQKELSEMFRMGALPDGTRVERHNLRKMPNITNRSLSIKAADVTVNNETFRIIQTYDPKKQTPNAINLIVDYRQEEIK